MNGYVKIIVILCYSILSIWTSQCTESTVTLTVSNNETQLATSATVWHPTNSTPLSSDVSLQNTTTTTPYLANTSVETTSTPAVSTSSISNVTETLPEYVELCPSGVLCELLGGECLDCDFNMSCHYGQNTSVACRAKPLISCLSARNFTRWFICRYCYQTPASLHTCTKSTGCRVATSPRQSYEANCTVRDDQLCLGRRRFFKMMRCNWTSGKRWSTALILSITLGGFGADRFYLGLWREGIGKLFSFGGLGVWTLVDVVLVATGYIGPADGSLYIV